MANSIEKAIAVVQDTKAGWVHRRDAVEFLAAAAGKAVDGLVAHREEPDVDVRAAVEKELGRLSAKVAGIAPLEEETARVYSLDELAQACEKPGKRSVAAWGEGYQVEVTLKDGRRQHVYIVPHREENRPPMVRIHTYCGQAAPGAFRWALKSNMRLVHGAVALTEEEGEERFVLVNSLLADKANPSEVKAAVKELSIYGDWIEKKLSGGADTL